MKKFARIIKFSALALPLLSGTAQAMETCDLTHYTFEYNIEHADVVFEATLAKVEMLPLPSDENLYVMAMTETVGKNWKGTTVGETVVYVGLPLTFSAADVPSMRESFPVLEEIGKTPRIFVLQKNTGEFSGMYGNGCGSDHYEATPERLKMLEEKFPSGGSVQ